MTAVGNEPPRVWTMLQGLAEAIAGFAGGGFEMVGPWTPSIRLDDGGGAGIRVAVTAGADRFDRALLDRLPDLETIVAFGAGHEGVDLVSAAERGIAIRTAGAIHSGDVADHALGMILAARRRLFEADRHVRAGAWIGGRMRPSRSMASARVGIVGLGHIGRAIADRLTPFGCAIRWWGPNPKPEAAWPRAGSLAELAAWCDILVVAAYGHDSTRGLVTRAIIEAVGADGLIVNISRGFVIDELALIAALKDGRLGQLATDVFETEPDDGAAWRELPNTILSPHSAGETVESFQALCRAAVANVRDALAASPRPR